MKEEPKVTAKRISSGNEKPKLTANQKTGVGGGNKVGFDDEDELLKKFAGTETVSKSIESTANTSNESPGFSSYSSNGHSYLVNRYKISDDDLLNIAYSQNLSVLKVSSGMNVDLKKVEIKKNNNDGRRNVDEMQLKIMKEEDKVPLKDMKNEKKMRSMKKQVRYEDEGENKIKKQKISQEHNINIMKKENIETIKKNEEKIDQPKKKIEKRKSEDAKKFIDEIGEVELSQFKELIKEFLE